MPGTLVAELHVATSGHFLRTSYSTMRKRLCEVLTLPCQKYQLARRSTVSADIELAVAEVKLDVETCQTQHTEHGASRNVQCYCSCAATRQLNDSFV